MTTQTTQPGELPSDELPTGSTVSGEQSSLQDELITLPANAVSPQSDCTATILHTLGWGEVEEICFLPDGRHILVAGSCRGSVHQLDVTSGAVVQRYEVEFGGMAGFSVSRDGKLLAVASELGAIRLWDTETGALLKTHIHSDCIRGIALSPDKSLLVVLADATEVRDASSFRLLTTLALEEGSIVSAKFSPNGSQLVGSGSNAEIALWDVKDWHRMYSRTQAGDRISDLAICQDGSLVASVSSDYQGDWAALVIREAKTGRPLHALPPGAKLYDSETKNAALAFSPDGKALVVGYQQKSTVQGWLTVYDTANGETVGGASLFFRGITAVSYSSDGSLLAVGFENGILGIWSTDYETWTWDLNNASLIVCGHTEGTIQLSPDGRFVASRCEGPVALDPYGRTAPSLSQAGIVRIWDTSTGSEIRSFDVSRLSTSLITLSPRGDQVAVKHYVPGQYAYSGYKNCVGVWDIRTGVCKASIAASEGVRAVGLGESRLAIVRDWVIELWDIPSASKICELRGHTERYITGIAFLLEQGVLISAGSDGTLRVWDTETGEPIEVIQVSELPSRVVLSVSADGKTMACAAEDGEVEIRDTETRQVTTRLAVQCRISEACLSGDGKLLALMTGAWDPVQIWNTNTGTQLCALSLPGSRVNSVALGPAGDLLAVGLSNGYGGAIVLCEMHYSSP